MKKIEFTATVFEGGFPKYEAGKQYDATPETERWVNRGSAKVVDVKVERKATAKQIAAAKKALAGADADLAAATEALQKASDEGLAAAQEAVTAAENKANDARALLASLEGDE